MKKFNDELFDNITHKHWVSVYRCTVETMIQNTDEFREDFLETLLRMKINKVLTLIIQACTEVIYKLGREYIIFIHRFVMYFVFTS